METENRNLKKKKKKQFHLYIQNSLLYDGPIVLIWIWICIEYEHCLLLQFSEMILRNLFFLRRYFDYYSFIWPIGSSKWCFKESQLTHVKDAPCGHTKACVYDSFFQWKSKVEFFVGIWKLYHGHTQRLSYGDWALLKIFIELRKWYKQLWINY